jgi:nicotinamide mononucleotide adenylyltransferase
MKLYSKVGVVGRFRPLHNGSATMLESLCEISEHLVIGIGSINRYNERNPFTAEEVKAMIDSFLSVKFTNYSFRFIPDFGHIPEFKDGKRWKQEIISQLGKLDLFVSGNDYVRQLLSDVYICKHPVEFIPLEKRIPLSGTDVRIEMAKNSNWQNLVPKEVSEYLQSHSLDERFRREFGLYTLSLLVSGYSSPKNIAEEMQIIGGAK